MMQEKLFLNFESHEEEELLQSLFEAQNYKLN